jgi:hypothetical protein
LRIRSHSQNLHHFGFGRCQSYLSLIKLSG